MKNIPIRSIQAPKPGADAFDVFKVRSLRDVLAGKNMNQDLHRHDFYFVLMVSSGTGIHEIDFVEHPVTDNSIYILRPGQVHRLHLNAGSEGYLLEFTKDFLRLSSSTGNEFLRKAAHRNYCKLEGEAIRRLGEILDTMLEEFTAKQEGYESVARATLEIFLIRFLRYRQKGKNPSNANPYQQEKLQEFMDLLEAHINTKKNVAAYAEMMSLSPFQLNSITKNLLGKTAAELIEDQILLEARRYLLATSNQVNQIAFHLGYEDVSYFIRFFKKKTGYTPEAFRKNFR